MKFQTNRWLISIIAGAVLTLIAYLAMTLILGSTGNNRFEPPNSAKRFNIELVYDVEREKVSGAYPNPSLLPIEIEALNIRADGWPKHSFYVTRDYKIAGTLQDVFAADTAMIIDSFHLSHSIDFYEMYSLQDQFSALERLFKLANGVHPQLILPPSSNVIDNYTAELGYVKSTDTVTVRKLFSDSSFARVAPNDAVFLFGFHNGSNKSKFVSIYAIRKPSRNINSSSLNESHIKQVKLNFSNQFPEVNIKLDHSGSRIFAELTKKNVNRSIAISVDNFILFAPRVFQPIFEGDIALSGNFTAAEIRALAFKLKCKPLPIPITLIRHSSHEVKKAFYKEHAIALALILSLIILSALTYLLYPNLGLGRRTF
jgi:SecD-like export protein